MQCRRARAEAETGRTANHHSIQGKNIMKIKPAKQPGHVVVELSASDSERLSKSAEKNGRAASSFKLKKILVPIDFSEYSKKAVQYAVPFARQFNARMIFLHVLPVRFTAGWAIDPVSYPMIEEDSKNEIETRLTALVRETVPDEIPVEIEVGHGVPSVEIVNTAREMDVDVIVMSTHGHTGLIHAFIGSVAGNVVRCAPCPVLVVREHEREFVQGQTNPFATNQVQPGLASATAA
jgi:universal stress protein A